MILILKCEGFGFHKMIKETDNLYYHYDKKIQRRVGVIKKKWYVFKF
jgi:hypothetical protein